MGYAVVTFDEDSTGRASNAAGAMNRCQRFDDVVGTLVYHVPADRFHYTSRLPLDLAQPEGLSVAVVLFMADTVRAQTIFAIIPLWLILKATPRAVQVYGVLAGRYANRDGEGAWPAHDTLAADLGVSTDSISRAIVELRDLGAIRTRDRRSASGAMLGLEYVLIHLRGTSGANRKSAVQDTSSNRKSADPEPHKRGSTKEIQTQGSRPKEYDARIAGCFERFRAGWKATYGIEAGLIESPLDFARMGEADRRLGDRLPAAIDGYFATRDDATVNKSRHALGLFLRDPSRYLADALPAAGARGAREETRAANIPGVTAGGIALGDDDEA